MEFRLRFVFLSLVALIAVAVWTFPAWRGYFRQPGEAMAFPGLDLELQDEFMALARAEREALLDLYRNQPAMALEMVLAAIDGPAAAPQSESDATMFEGARALSSGEFNTISALYWGEGSATVYELVDGRRVLRFENFISATGVDVHVYLARDVQPLEARQLRSDDLHLGRLKGNVGDQLYHLPTDHDLSVYRSAVVFCRRFDKVITVATLR